MLTQQEIQAAANESLLSAAKCSLRHWQEDICDSTPAMLLTASYHRSFCALCLRANPDSVQCKCCGFHAYYGGCELGPSGVYRHAADSLHRFARGEISRNECRSACLPMARKLAAFVAHLEAKARHAESSWWERVQIPVPRYHSPVYLRWTWCDGPRTGYLFSFGQRRHLVVHDKWPHQAYWRGHEGDGVESLPGADYFTPEQAHRLFPDLSLRDVEVLPQPKQAIAARPEIVTK